MNERRIDSFIELIWPLPGETLETFNHGIEQLIKKRASVVVIYPHVLLHNTPLSSQREELGIKTHTIRNIASEAEVVVQTAELSFEDYQRGMWTIYSVLVLHNMRGLTQLTYYLQQNEIISITDLFQSFITFCQDRPDNFFTKYCQESIDTFDFYEVNNYPMAYFMTLNTQREAFMNTLHEFVSTQFWWDDPKAHFLFEVDMLNLMYLYSNVAFAKPAIPFNHFKFIAAEDRSYTVEIPPEFIHLLAETSPDMNRDLPSFSGRAPHVFLIDHRREQYPFTENQSNGDLADYCYGMIMRSARNLPTWETTSQPDLATV